MNLKKFVPGNPYRKARRLGLLAILFTRNELKDYLGLGVSWRDLRLAHVQANHDGVSGIEPETRLQQRGVSSREREKALVFAIDFIISLLVILPWGEGKRVWVNGIPRSLPAASRKLKNEAIVEIYRRVTIRLNHEQKNTLSRSSMLKLISRSSNGETKISTGADSSMKKYGHDQLEILRREVDIVAEHSTAANYYKAKILILIDEI